MFFVIFLFTCVVICVQYPLCFKVMLYDKPTFFNNAKVKSYIYIIILLAIDLILKIAHHCQIGCANILLHIHKYDWTTIDWFFYFKPPSSPDLDECNHQASIIVKLTFFFANRSNMWSVATTIVSLLNMS